MCLIWGCGPGGNHLLVKCSSVLFERNVSVCVGGGGGMWVLGNVLGSERGGKGEKENQRLAENGKSGQGVISECQEMFLALSPKGNLLPFRAVRFVLFLP